MSSASDRDPIVPPSPGLQLTRFLAPSLAGSSSPAFVGPVPARAVLGSPAAAENSATELASFGRILRRCSLLEEVFYANILTTSAVSSKNLGSMLIFATCVNTGSCSCWSVNELATRNCKNGLSGSFVRLEEHDKPSRKDSTIYPVLGTQLWYAATDWLYQAPGRP